MSFLIFWFIICNFREDTVSDSLNKNSNIFFFKKEKNGWELLEIRGPDPTVPEILFLFKKIHEL